MQILAQSVILLRKSLSLLSYSRWGSRGSGHWYTFRRAPSTDELATRDNALFAICDVCTFTAKELRDDIKACLNIVAKKDLLADKDKLDELCIYMSEFLKDVDEAYLHKKD